MRAALDLAARGAFEPDLAGGCRPASLTSFVPGRFVLRQYYFLGEEHFLGIQTSGAAIIHTGTPSSLEEWAPPEKLLDLRRRLGLDYGRIDFVLVDGKPFVLSVNRAPILPEGKEPGSVPPAYIRLGEALAEALTDTYAAMEKAVF